ncbi:reverse transcriptase family protein [Leptospira interrogans]|uniref:reverse transcriptase family protein n=1 Tax=Leptospira interrogans TaxID=173 RepID=UPI0002B91A8B|nr:reverse transcriptase domain-containing protein [Leptospira interrogans]MCR8649134.1 hypothetical protein [Leptospira interrogans serovar Bataviae]OAM86096.1 hypothetical protein A1343_15795 [Leptospira interrogans serovar Bataviae]QOI40454.1 RNA-directed DNA polymerase [Leptospira interrogans serovar Bataviae]
MNVSYTKTKDIVDRKSYPYKHFSIKKRNGGFRNIHIPQDELRLIQKWIHKNILLKNNYKDCAFAYIPGRNIKMHAERHCMARWLLKIDLENFFENTTERRVFHVFRNMGYSKKMSFDFARLSTIPMNIKKKESSGKWKNRFPIGRLDRILGSLPQGAPSSPLLSNLCFSELDRKIISIADSFEFVYTRYSDDLVFSCFEGDRIKVIKLLKSIRKLLSMYGYRINNKKIKIITPGARKIITGLNINQNTPKVSKSYITEVNKHLYYCKKFGPLSHCERIKFRNTVSYRDHLKGRIDYIRLIDPVEGTKLLQKFELINWPLI